MTRVVPVTGAAPLAQPCQVLTAPAHWRQIDFISDLHLQAGDSATLLTWQTYRQTTPADAVFILGDLFEVWVGDDVAVQAHGADEPPASVGFEAHCAQILKSASQQRSLYFMHGNRDFLLGPAYAEQCGMRLLADPCALDFAGQRWLLAHGDALCLGDTEYLQFREQVRSDHWQQSFLKKPLAERQTLARGLRAQSEARKRSGAPYSDVDSQAACALLDSVQARTLIHGHTHQPADHDLDQDSSAPLRRLVLSDWDATATPPRLEVLRLTTCARMGCQIQRLPV